MQTYGSFFFSIWIKFFFLLTPFFVLSTFLSKHVRLAGRHYPYQGSAAMFPEHRNCL